MATFKWNLPAAYVDAWHTFEEAYAKASLVQVKDGTRCNEDLNEPVAIFVLGPSAAGKTFSTKLNLPLVLEENHLPSDLCFTTIDGGIMRSISLVWKEITQISKVCPRSPGIKDAHDLFAGAYSRRKKFQMFNNLVKQKKHLIIPDTAPGCSLASWKRVILSSVWKSPCKAWDFYKELHNQGYKIIMTAVSADKETCADRGKMREQSEGKIYSGKQWRNSVKAIPALFQEAREIGNENTFFIFDNNESPDRNGYRPPQVFQNSDQASLTFVSSGIASFGGDRAQARLEAGESDGGSTDDESLSLDVEELEDEDDLDENVDRTLFESVYDVGLTTSELP